MKTEKLFLEIIDGEGGEDAKLLINEMCDIYIKNARTHKHTIELIETRDGYTSFWITGKNILNFYLSEAGEHVWHRVSPTEKRNRTHTSTVKVLVMDISDEDVININRNEVEKIYTRGMGSGGQHKNVTNSCVILKHTPTGLQARIDGRVQKQNEKLAWKILEQRVLNFYKNIKDKEIRNDKMSQINNLRIRTYKVKDDLVIDHRHNRRCSLKQIYKGKLELLKE